MGEQDCPNILKAKHLQKSDFIVIGNKCRLAFIECYEIYMDEGKTGELSECEYWRAGDQCEKYL